MYSTQSTTKVQLTMQLTQRHTIHNQHTHHRRLHIHTKGTTSTHHTSTSRDTTHQLTRSTKASSTNLRSRQLPQRDSHTRRLPLRVTPRRSNQQYNQLRHTSHLQPNRRQRHHEPQRRTVPQRLPMQPSNNFQQFKHINSTRRDHIEQTHRIIT